MIRGFIEVIRPFQVRGWAYDPEMPDAALEISLSIGGEYLLTATASIFRDDLLRSGIGSGRHGFVLNVDRRLPTGSPGDIRVQCQSPSGGSVTLPTVANPVMDEASTRDRDQAAVAAGVGREASSIVGYFNVSPPFDVAGWAYDRRQPEEHLTVEILSEGRRIGSAIAEHFRTDLLPALVGNGDHGFSVTTSDLIIGSVEVVARSADGTIGYLQSVSPTVPTTAPSVKRVEPELGFRGCSQNPAHHPVFILGAARSGTSAVAQALVAATRYVGQEEGHLLDLIAPLLHQVQRHYEEQISEWRDRQNTMIGAVSKQFFEAGICHVFVEMACALFPHGWWIDKTPRPAMIAAAPMLKQVWPEARFIFMKRRGIENIVSRMAKFRTVSFEDHCRDWVQAMQAWTVTRGFLRGAALEIDQLYVATRPHEAAAMLAPFLMLQPREVVNLGHALATDRPERTAEHFAAAISFDALHWTPEQREMFSRLCGPTMAAYGYGMGDAYYSDGCEDPMLVRIE